MSVAFEGGIATNGGWLGLSNVLDATSYIVVIVLQALHVIIVRTAMTLALQVIARLVEKTKGCFHAYSSTYYSAQNKKDYYYY